MSSSALAHSIGELLKLQAQPDTALSGQHQMPTRGPPRPGYPAYAPTTSYQPTPFLPQHQQEAPRPFLEPESKASEWLQTASDLKRQREIDVLEQVEASRRGSVGSVASTAYSAYGSAASTWAGASSIDSLEQDAASDTSGPTVPREMAESILAESMLQAQADGLAPRTTLKIANIPRRCTKEELLAAIRAVGFGNEYDFFYLPLGPQSKKNHGYAFINFKSNEMADRFRCAFVGYPIRAKLLDVMPAPVQGLAQNLEHFSKTRATRCGWVPNVVLKV